jgi:hypothetical protein
METRLRKMLHDLATEMPVDAEGRKDPTLRRARGRRVLTAGAGVAAVVAIVVMSVSALRLVEPPTSLPAVTGPNPTPAFEGLWPETDPQALAATQAAVDQGHMPLRTTPDGTATLLATNLLGWQRSDLVNEPEVLGRDAEIVLSNPMFGDNVGVITVDLRQLGDTGPNGVWSVVGVSVPPVPYPPVIRLDDVAEAGPGTIHLTGRLSDRFDGAPALEARVFDGPTQEPVLGSARYKLSDRTFSFDVEVSPTPDGRATLLLTMPDASGESLGAALVPIRTPVGAPPSEPSVNVDGVSPDVAVTAQRIYDAAMARDFDALAELIDPNTFDLNLEPGTNPIPAWQADPSQLDTIVAILEMAPTTREIGEGQGTFSFWPYLVNTDFGALTERERADLAALGYSEREIRLMIDGGNGYQGPRLAIDAAGQWRNFITAGE